MGLEFAEAQGTLVITFGLENTEKDVVRFLTALKETVKTLRSLSLLYKKAHQTEHQLCSLVIIRAEPWNSLNEQIDPVEAFIRAFPMPK
jgi:hypothetical protein